MKIGWRVDNNEVKFSALGLWIFKSKDKCLFTLLDKAGVEIPLPRPSISEFGDLRLWLFTKKRYAGASEALAKVAGYPVEFYCLGVDPLSNALTLCPPLAARSTGVITMEADRYERAVLLHGLPAVIVDMENVAQIVTVRPPVPLPSVEPTDGESAQEPVGDSIES